VILEVIQRFGSVLQKPQKDIKFFILVENQPSAPSWRDWKNATTIKYETLSQGRKSTVQPSWRAQTDV
jgi:hypothetical protein